MKLATLVHNWLLGGSDPEVGLRLFCDYCKVNRSLFRNISRDPARHLQIIRVSLLYKSGLPISEVTVPSKSTHTETKKARELRDQWPFLADPECPPELKLLISDKITAYRNCVDLYDELTGAISVDQQLDKVSNLVSNFINDYHMFTELDHFKKTGQVLGKHVIFEQYNRIKQLRNLDTMELFKKRTNLRNAIWRNEAKIKKENREDLLESRREHVKQLKMQLAEVDRLLS